MPKFRKFLMDKNKENNPSYEYYLWTNDNITRKNFPVSYDLIQRLIEFNNGSRHNKMSMVADLMRAEIIYNNGGISINTNYLVLRKGELDDWLSFKAVIGTHVFPSHRSQRESSIFAAMKGYPRLKRIVDHRAISTRNYYSIFPPAESGPAFFSHVI